jgi:glutamate-1-semialdehyde 2,1-aminomutase
MKALAEKAGIPAFFTRVGSRSCMFFNDAEVVDFASAARSDTEKFGRYFRSMLEQGINLAPSQFEAGFVSLAHSKDDIEKTLAAVEKSFSSL